MNRNADIKPTIRGWKEMGRMVWELLLGEEKTHLGGRGWGGYL